LYKLY